MKPLLTPRELAQAVSVSESSVKRWVDGGEIEATRTSGGHRRISIQEAGRFLRERSLPLVRPDIFGLPGAAAPSGVEREEDTATRLFGYLREGAEAEARGLVLALYLEGDSVAEIIDGPITTAMARIGELWNRDPSTIFWEHRATQIAMQVLGRLRALLWLPEDAPVAVGGAPEGDCYFLPSMAVAAVLEGKGVRAVNLGAGTPTRSVARGVLEQNACLAWLSVSHAEAPDRLRDDVVDLMSALTERGTPLVVGGSQVETLGLPDENLLHVGHTMAELEALVESMGLEGPFAAASASGR